MLHVRNKTLHVANLFSIIRLLSVVSTAEVEELAGRLKASRQRVTDLEKNLSTSNSANQKLDRSNKELMKDLEKLKLETYKNR